MADMQIMTMAGGSGDVLICNCDDRIHRVHAEHICFPRYAGSGELLNRNGYGYLPNDSFQEEFMEKIYEFRNERRDTKKVIRVTIATGDEEDVSDTMNVVDHVEFKIRSGLEPVFGTKRKEIWYSGDSNYSGAPIADIWTKIEATTGNLKADHGQFPYGIKDKKYHLIIPIKPLTLAQAHDRMSPVIDETDPEKPIVTEEKKYTVDWKNLRDVSPDTITKINDYSIAMDFRKFSDYDWEIDSILKV